MEASGVGYWDDGWAWMAFMPLIWIALVGMVVWALVRVAQSPASSDPGSKQSDRETPEEILDRRFACGEIDAEAHRRAREHLAGQRKS